MGAMCNPDCNGGYGCACIERDKTTDRAEFCAPPIKILKEKEWQALEKRVRMLEEFVDSYYQSKRRK